MKFVIFAELPNASLVSVSSHRVCCSCKGLNFHLTKTLPISRNQNSRQLTPFSAELFYMILFMTQFWVQCLMRVLFELVGCYISSLVHMYNLECTSGEEWKTRNKYSFGVTCLWSWIFWVCALVGCPLGQLSW